MRRATLSLLALACACAPAGAGLHTTSGPQTTRVYVQGGGNETVHEFNRTSTDAAASFPVGAARAEAWNALAGVLGQWNLPITAADPAAFTLGSVGTAPRRLAGAQLSTFLNCGVGGATRAPLANSYEVRLDLSAALRENGAGASTLEVLVRGTARDPVHNNPPVPCTSTGRLEQLVANEVAGRVLGT